MGNLIFPCGSSQSLKYLQWRYMVPLSTKEVLKAASCTSIPRLDACYQLHHLHLLMWVENTMVYSILYVGQG